eukprot:4612378-Alexandrium_andersonii.AAC.1
MSASLVGSEMCIRDRSKPAQASGAHARIRALPIGAAAAFLLRRALPLAVSYTHLTLPTICSV